MFYNEEIAESCPDTKTEFVDESDANVYLSSSLNYLTGLGSGWLGNIWEKAKEQSNVAITATKRDLTEFVTVIHRDTSNAVSVVGDSAISLTEKIVQSADGCGDSNETDQSGTGLGRLIDTLLNKSQKQYTPFKERLAIMQTSLSTYTTDYEDEDYTEWKSNFNVDNFKDRISQLLVENTEVKKIHTELVPSVVSYSIFWMRYLYREQILRKEEDISKSLHDKETEFGWDSDSDIATPTNTRKKFHIESPSSSMSFQQIGSPDGADIDSDDSNSRHDNISSADSFVSIEEPDEAVAGSMSTKEILEQKIAMVASVKITASNDSSADNSSDSIMVIDPQDVDNISPKLKHSEDVTGNSSPKPSVMDFIHNMTVGSPNKSKHNERNEEWPDWD
ncbi:BSD domain-containing protein 1-like [Oopsacas minuta]|uniref:BSD domain-containing protein 1-like n=1 Tax=Oopsacas minuta TaxID=111878 RepID=A0AAV7KG32_9METZ|nr:BSD domain-containing protein 1-like [Oopsacas minuta]